MSFKVYPINNIFDETIEMVAEICSSEIQKLEFLIGLKFPGYSPVTNHRRTGFLKINWMHETFADA